MTECDNNELQDLLPEYIAESLDDITMARVAAHVAGCSVCAEDVSVLVRVREARPRIAVPDIARIVAALPPAVVAAPRLVLTRSATAVGAREEQSVASPRATPRHRTRIELFGMSMWRSAAMLAVMVAGGTSLVMARRGVVGVQAPAASARQLGESASVVAVLPERGVDTGAAAAAASVSVSYGDLGDYSEAELQRMLDRLDKWDGTTNTEPLPGVPIVPSSGGSTP
jgi:hypothetical protein